MKDCLGTGKENLINEDQGKLCGYKLGSRNSVILKHVFHEHSVKFNYQE